MDRKMKKSVVDESSDVDWDLAPPCSTLQLFYADRCLKEAQRDLIVKCIDAQRERTYHVCNWQEIQDNKTELRRQFKTINKTICDNKASARRFKQKIKEFMSAQVLVQDEINRVQSEIEKYSVIKEKMEEYVTMYSGLFTSYLEVVTQKCPEFKSVQNILNRYEVLKNCSNTCSELLKYEMDQALELKREMNKLVEEKASRLKMLGNSIVLLEVRRKRAGDNRNKWTQVVTRLEEIIADKLEESVTLNEGCYDLYRLVCNKRKVKPVITKDDTKNQMHYIEKTILFYKDVIHLALALQQYQTQEVQTENSICKGNFVKRILNDLVKQSLESIHN